MKNKFHILSLLLFVLFGCAKKNSEHTSATSLEDSISSYLSFAKDPNLSLIERKGYNQKAFVIIISQPNDSMNKVNLFRVANRYYNMNEWKGYKETVHVILEKSEVSKDTVNKAKAYNYLGDYYASQAISDSAFMYYSQAEKIYDQRNDNYNLARARWNKALLQYNEGDFAGSEITVFKALRAIKGQKANDVIYDLYNLLGAIYNEQGEYDKAMEFHNKALASIDDKIIPLEFQSKATSFNNMGYVSQNLHKYKQAISYFKKGLEQKDVFNHKPSLYAILLDNMAYSKFKLKEYDGLPELFYQSLKLRDSLQLTSGIISSKIHLSEYFASQKGLAKAIEYSKEGSNLSEYFTSMNNTQKATQYAKEALELSRSTNSYRDVLVSLKLLATIEPRKAATYTKEYIQINDSLQKAERKMGDKFARIEYETDEIKEKNSSLTTQNRNILFFFGAVVILGLLIFVIKAQKAKNRELLFKQEQQKVNEEIYNLMISQQSTIEKNRVEEKKRVAQELHDGVLGRMFGVRMNLDSLNKIHDEPAVQQRNSYISELKNIEQDIREISHDLNREKSELINNFVAIVENLLEDQKKTFKSKLVSTIDSNIKWELMSNTIKINLYRIVQESLQNINKYASASAIKVEFKKEGDNLFLAISDDGIGFEVGKKIKGIGLQNIRSRTEECEGTFDIKSKKGEGTIVTVTVPIEQNKNP